jgi:hypothetical protein
MTEANEWLIRIGEQEHRAPDLETVKQWCADGRVPMTALIYHPSLGEWTRPMDVPSLVEQPLATALQSQADPNSPKVFLYGLGVLLVLVLIGFVSVRLDNIKRNGPKNLADEFRRADAELQANNLKAARTRYESIISSLDGTYLINENARAQAGLAATLALLGDEAGAQAAFVEAIEMGESSAPPSNAEAVMAALSAARTQVEDRARTRRENEQTRKEEAQAREMKSRLEGTARRYIEHETGDGDVEITNVGDPYMNGGYWAVQVYYVKDDHRGRRAKVTVVLFSPLNYEAVGARDVI